MMAALRVKQLQIGWLVSLLKPGLWADLVREASFSTIMQAQSALLSPRRPILVVRSSGLAGSAAYGAHRCLLSHVLQIDVSIIVVLEIGGRALVRRCLSRHHATAAFLTDDLIQIGEVRLASHRVHILCSASASSCCCCSKILGRAYCRTISFQSCIAPHKSQCVPWLVGWR